MIERFDLEARHERHREAVREFCEREIDPHLKEHEREGTFPEAVVREVGRAGQIGRAHV